MCGGWGGGHRGDARVDDDQQGRVHPLRPARARPAERFSAPPRAAARRRNTGRARRGGRGRGDYESFTQ